MTRMGGTGGCMFGGSEEDLCLPERSMEPGFHAGEPWGTPPWPLGCPVEITDKTKRDAGHSGLNRKLAQLPDKPKTGCFFVTREVDKVPGDDSFPELRLDSRP